MPKIGGATEGDGVQAVVVALKLLEYLAMAREPVGVTALAQALGSTKSRIHRHLRTLVQQGYIVQSGDTERYRVGSRLVTLGRMVGENLDLASAGREVLRELRDSLGRTAVISQVEAEGMRVLATLPGTSAVDLQVKEGSLLGFHYSAQGKVALAFVDEAHRTRILRGRLEKPTPRTITSSAALRQELQQIRERGWATAPDQSTIGFNALATPIFDASGSIVGTLAIVSSIQFIAAEPSAEQIHLLVSGADRISRALGGVGLAGQPPALPPVLQGIRTA